MVSKSGSENSVRCDICGDSIEIWYRTSAPFERRSTPNLRFTGGWLCPVCEREKTKEAPVTSVVFNYAIQCNNCKKIIEHSVEMQDREADEILKESLARFACNNCDGTSATETPFTVGVTSLTSEFDWNQSDWRDQD